MNENVLYNDKDNKSDDENDDAKKNKLHLPKRKYAIIHGYNGHKFSGNQKYF